MSGGFIGWRAGSLALRHLGREEEAIRYYEKAIQAGIELENVSHTDLGTCSTTSRSFIGKAGRQQAAEPYYQHALEIYEKQLGPEHRMSPRS